MVLNCACATFKVHATRWKAADRGRSCAARSIAAPRGAPRVAQGELVRTLFSLAILSRSWISLRHAKIFTYARLNLLERDANSTGVVVIAWRK